MEKIPLLLIFLGHVWVDTSQGILPVVLLKLKELFTLSYFQVGLMVTTLSITSSVIQPVFGHISDRVRTGWFVPLGILWTALNMGLLGWAPSYLSALLLVGLAGLGTAAFHPRAMMGVFLISGSRRGLGVGIFTAGGNLGFAMGPVVGGFLVLGLGLHATVGLVPPGVLLALVLFLHRGALLGREVLGRVGSKGVSQREAYVIPWASLVAVCLIITLRSWVYMSFVTYLPMFLQLRGIDPRVGSIMLTVFLMGGAAAGLYGGHLSDQVGRRSVIAGTMLLYPVFMSLMILSRGVWLWPLAGIAGAALLASYSVTLVLIQELLPRNLGLASGLGLGLSFGTGGLGAALSGYLADMVGLHETMWILALFPALAVLLVLFIKERGPSVHM
jgi:FSR family fosmidomycin resistance protein-like MFS transporter